MQFTKKIGDEDEDEPIIQKKRQRKQVYGLPRTAITTITEGSDDIRGTDQDMDDVNEDDNVYLFIYLFYQNNNNK